MNLHEAWKALDLEKPLPKGPAKVELGNRSSKHPIVRLKRAYLISTIFSILFLCVFVYLFFRFEEQIVQYAILFMIGAYVLFTHINIRAFKKVDVDFSMDGDVRSVLVNTYNFVVANIRYQEKVGLFIYPPAVAAGYLMGLSESSGEATSIIAKTIPLLVLAITVIILTPLCWWLARWMYRVSYGIYLKELESLIAEMDEGRRGGARASAS